MRRAVVVGLLAVLLGAAAFEAGRQSARPRLQAAEFDRDTCEARLMLRSVVVQAEPMPADPSFAPLQAAWLSELQQAQLDRDARAIRRAGRLILPRDVIR